VLVELGLVHVDVARRSVTLEPAQPTRLERSATFRDAQRRLEDGRRRLSPATAQAA
jgi:hypothetical protein